jgi:hypothetical protein
VHKTTIGGSLSIIVAQRNKGAKRLERTVIQHESYLQQYILEHPDTLPLQELKEDLKLLILAREFPTTSGPIDALGVDADGDVYLIETKLYKNPDKRLVLAQILDYGAALWRAYEEPEAFLERIDELLSIRQQATLAARVTEFYALEGSALTDFMEGLKRSVSAGRFHFVVLMDRLDDRLKDLISFINANSKFLILGVGLDFYQHGELDILIPTIFGAETKKSSATTGGSGRRKWDSGAFFADAEARLEPNAVAALRRLWQWSETQADEVSWGSGARTGSFSAKFAKIDPRSVFSVYSSGELSLNFKWLNSSDTTIDWARRLGEELRKSDLLPLPNNFMEKYVYVPVDKWMHKVTGFTELMERSLS